MLTRLQVSCVRNLVEQTLELTSGITLVTGANAQGKSSLLEAIYLLATTRSFRSREPREAIAENAAFLHVKGHVEHPSQPPFQIGISLGQGRGERHLSVGESAPKLVDYLALLPVLFQAGESVRVIAGSPAERRRFMDRVTAAADPVHVADLTRYAGALTQRNRLLRGGAPDREFEPWEQILRSLGGRVAMRRREQIAAWQQWLGAWPELFPEGREARLHYKQATGPENLLNDAAQNEAESWRRLRQAERKVGVTLTGPHRDDLVIEAAGKDLLRFGSAGQIRAALSALTLAQARAVRERRSGVDLLMLLDDLDTDLDAARCFALLDYASAQGQVIAATSKPEIVPRSFAAVWHVQAGVATRRDSSRP